MSFPRALIVALFCFTCSIVVRSQGGFRIIAGHIEPVYPATSDGYSGSSRTSSFISSIANGGYHFGIGYDHDLADRLSMGVDFMFTTGIFSGEGSVYTLQYRTAFYFASNSEASAYIGPSIGFRSASLTKYTYNSNAYTYTSSVTKATDNSTLIPIGLRVGFRGDLRLFYADVYAGFVVQLGGESSVDTAPAPTPKPVTFVLGVDFGFGWDKRSR
jgi:hypothetical protein